MEVHTPHAKCWACHSCWADDHSKVKGKVANLDVSTHLAHPEAEAGAWRHASVTWNAMLILTGLLSRSSCPHLQHKSFFLL